MNPRKKESKKWSPIPAELVKQIKTVFEESFSAHLNQKTLKVEGRIYPSEILMRIGIKAKTELRYQNFEVSIDYSADKQETMQKITLSVDAIASLMVDYFDSEETHEMPLVWQEYPFDNENVWLQYTSTNQELEAEANKLLGVDDSESLLVESQEELDALEIPDDEEIDTSKPKIFRVPTNNPNDTMPKKKKKEEMH